MDGLRIALLLTVAMALGGCDVTTSANASRGGVVVPQSSGSAFNSLIGSRIGASLDEQDRELAYGAQINALENGAPGAPVPWSNPQSGRHGNIVAGPAYDIRGATCRGYSHTVAIGADLKTTRGTACRRPDGNWVAAG
jgi:surface antigen